MDTPTGRTVILDEAQIEKVAELHSRGATRKMIAFYLGITETTLRQIFKRQPHIEQEMGKQRLTSNITVVNALYDQAVGYHYVEEEVHKEKYVNENGKPCERVVKLQVKKYRPGVPTASTKYLEKMMKETWGDESKGRVFDDGIGDVIEAATDTTRGLPSDDQGTKDFQAEFGVH